MKRTLILCMLVASMAIFATSCMTQQGCKVNQGYVGYGR